MKIIHEYEISMNYADINADILLHDESTKPIEIYLKESDLI